MYSSDSFHREGNHRDSNRGRYLDLRRDFCDLFFHGLNIRRYRFSLSLPLSLFSLHEMLPAWCRWEFRKQFIINSIKHRPLISNYRANINLNHEKERERERGGREIWENLIRLDVARFIAYEITRTHLESDGWWLKFPYYRYSLAKFSLHFPLFHLSSLSSYTLIQIQSAGAHIYILIYIIYMNRLYIYMYEFP